MGAANGHEENRPIIAGFAVIPQELHTVSTWSTPASAAVLTNPNVGRMDIEVDLRKLPTREGLKGVRITLHFIKEAEVEATVETGGTDDANGEFQEDTEYKDKIYYDEFGREVPPQGTDDPRDGPPQTALW